VQKFAYLRFAELICGPVNFALKRKRLIIKLRITKALPTLSLSGWTLGSLFKGTQRENFFGSNFEFSAFLFLVRLKY
jgi:hypothetical protein